MAQNKPQLTKSWLTKRFSEGVLVSTVLAEVNATLPEGKKLSEGKFKQGLTSLGISLRKKPRPTPVVFVDDTVAETSNEVSVEEVVAPEATSDVIVAEIISADEVPAGATVLDSYEVPENTRVLVDIEDAVGLVSESVAGDVESV